MMWRGQSGTAVDLQRERIQAAVAAVKKDEPTNRTEELLEHVVLLMVEQIKETRRGL